MKPDVNHSLHHRRPINGLQVVATDDEKRAEGLFEDPPHWLPAVVSLPPIDSAPAGTCPAHSAPRQFPTEAREMERIGRRRATGAREVPHPLLCPQP